MVVFKISEMEPAVEEVGWRGELPHHRFSQLFNSVMSNDDLHNGFLVLISPGGGEGGWRTERMSK